MGTRKEAGRLRNQLESRLGVKPKIKLGGQGQLDVIVNRRVVFSRRKAGRYPTIDEIVQAIDGGSTVEGSRNAGS